MIKNSLLLVLTLSLTSIATPADNDGDAKVDGEYIMHHIQDDRVFEMFNPFDWNDSNNDHYYFTNKIKLDRPWNKLKNIPFHKNLFFSKF